MSCKLATFLSAAAMAAWIATAVLAGDARSLALGLAGALTVAAIITNTRQAAAGVKVVTVAVAQAPRNAYWRGYEDRGTDAAAKDVDDEPTTDLGQLHSPLHKALQ